MILNCPECGKRLHVRDELAGQKGKCPGCGAVLRVPELPSGIQEAIPPPGPGVSRQQSPKALAEGEVLAPEERAKKLSRWMWVGSGLAVTIGVLVGVFRGRGGFSAAELATAACNYFALSIVGGIFGRLLGSFALPRAAVRCPKCDAYTTSLKRVSFLGKKLPNMCNNCGYQWQDAEASSQ